MRLLILSHKVLLYARPQSHLQVQITHYPYAFWLAMRRRVKQLVFLLVATEQLRKCFVIQADPRIGRL